MPVVKINAIHVPEGKGPELEHRFSGRAHAVDGQPGFEGFQLHRPVKGYDRYVLSARGQPKRTTQNWRNGKAGEHDGGGSSPVATGADLLEFEVVEF